MINCVNLSKYNNYYVNTVRSKKAEPAVSAPVSRKNNATEIKQFSPVSFSGMINMPRTSLLSSEQKLYTTVLSTIPKESQAQLNDLLKRGILLKSDSNDNTTTLENMYKIATEPRAMGLDKKIILSELIKTLSNPFVITQKFGDIPDKELENIISNPTNYKPQDNSKAENYTTDIKNVHSSDCVAASIEFDLASKQPAEFARIANGLTSDKMCVEKKIKTETISKNYAELFSFLKEFNAEYKTDGWDNLIMTMRPDRNAIIRARIQMTHKDKNERSLIDVLMQSTFMNIGSQKTYNSLTDERTGKFNPDNTGLTDIEKSFAETVATGKNKDSVVYQKIDDNGMITGYEFGADKIKKQIFDALNMGENVIIGYTQQDSTGKVINGHEITIVRLEKDKDGKEVFLCNDTDDESDLPVKYYVDDLLPAIHHAGLPVSIARAGEKEETPAWHEIMKYYKTVA